MGSTSHERTLTVESRVGGAAIIATVIAATGCPNHPHRASRALLDWQTGDRRVAWMRQHDFPALMPSGESLARRMTEAPL